MSGASSSQPPPEILAPVLDLSAGVPDPVAIAMWHMALGNLIGAEVPHQLFGLWVFSSRGGAVLIGPEALSQDNMKLPEPDPFLSQDQLFELEETLRRARYASAVAVPVVGPDRTVGLALFGTFEPGAYGPGAIRRLQGLSRQLAPTLDALGRSFTASGGANAITRAVDQDDLPASVAEIAAGAPSGPELVRQLSGLLHAHLPHDRLELLAFANGSGAALPLSGLAPRRRWGASAATWADLARLVGEFFDGETTAVIADLGGEAPGLSWPGGTGGPARVTSVLGARLTVGDQAVGLLLLGHAAGDVYRPSDEQLAATVARLVSARVAALRLESEVHALRGQLEVLQAPSLPVLRAAEALAGTTHLGEALHLVGTEIREVIPHTGLRFQLRWSETEAVELTADGIRPLHDLPVYPIESLATRAVLEGERQWTLVQHREGSELAVALRVAQRTIGAMVIEGPEFGAPRDAAAAATQFAGSHRPPPRAPPPERGQASPTGCRSGPSTGRMNQKVLPSPAIDSTPMVPPWSSTRALANARPNPVPCCRRLVEAST